MQGRMTCNILILYTTDTDELTKELLTCLNNVSINSICLDDEEEIPKLSHIQKLSNSRLYIIFFSPKFLTFLETKPLDAFYICNQLEPKSVVAIFCNGLAEKDIRCYHTASLRDFNSWSKFHIEEQSHGSEKKRVFPTDLINKVKSVIYNGCSEKDDVIVVPQYLTKDNNTVYVIFSKAIEKSDDIKIRLDNKMSCEVAAESMNPYVLKFSLFNSFLYSPHVVSIMVLKNGTIMAQQKIHLLWDMQRLLSRSPENGKNFNLRHVQSTQEEINLDEQLRFLSYISEMPSDINDLEYTSYPTILQSNLQKTKENDVDDELNFKTLCEHYGVKDSSLSMDEDTASSINSTELTIKESDVTEKEVDDFEKNSLGSTLKLPDMDASYQMKSFIEVDSAPVSRYTRRSLSLPSTLISVTENWDSEEYYLDMTNKKHTESEKKTKPHEKLIQNMVGNQDNLASTTGPTSPSSLSSGHYVTMNIAAVEQRNRLSLLKRPLTRSQQELLHLLHGCKMGDTTISNAENEFQQWRERHCITNSEKREPLRLTHEKARKMMVFSFPWKKSKKESKITDQQNKVSPTITDSSLHSTLSRKISNTSSNSSKASVASQLSVQRFGDATPEFIKENGFSEPPRWVSTDPRAYNKTQCPLYPQNCPPPLPTRPPPQKPIPHTRPIPLPRKMKNLKKVEPIYVNLIKENDKCECEAEKNTDDSFKNEFQSFVDLCEKYGLDELGECFISGALFVNSISLRKRKNSNFERHSTHLKRTDAEGYEALLKNDLQSNRKKVSLRRSNSLPSTFEKSGEYTDVNFEIDNNKKVVERESLNIQLNDSQQELLELMNTFKRGDKTISQVEEQFKEWHARHVDLPANLASSPKSKPRKILKQPSFSIPGLRNFILGRPKKKTHNEKHSIEIESPKNKRSKGSSDACSSPAMQNRLSKISVTSTSSGSSDHNEVKLQKKNNGSCSDIQKKPLPPIPISAHCPEKINKSNEKAKITKEDDYRCRQQARRSPIKPVPAPKPKILFRQKSNAMEPEKSRIDLMPEVEAPSPPSSPDYIIPKNRSFREYQLNKFKERAAAGSVTNKVKNTQISTEVKTEKVLLPTRISHATNVSRPFLNSTSSSVADDGPVLPPETLLLLKEANLISPEILPTPTKNEMSLFYVRRCSSVPSMSLQHLSSQPIYLELLGQVEGEPNRMSNTLNVGHKT
ncbi:uncharacterized protein [Parasteatoda tepidariorum]|uniref:uncharacterized protein isoform X1 n=1 Tax=Parasteatoda tepidariorum TaxID=114398 RepID=UPI001C724226|nr:uncharacterized protein LOC107436675 isoform X2 [Parasteatoda tepidariorum]